MHAQPTLLPAPSSGTRKNGRWDRFVCLVCPWLRYKVEQGEAYVRAQIEKEQALAEKTRAEARHHDADAAKAFAEAERLQAESRQIRANIALTAIKELRAMRQFAGASDAHGLVTVDEILGKTRDDRQRLS